MPGPVKKLFGSVSLDGIKKAVVSIPGKVQESEKYGKQLQVQGAEWEDGAISISIYNGETKESINIGRLMLSKFTDDNQGGGGAPSPADTSDDLPF